MTNPEDIGVIVSSKELRQMAIDNELPDTIRNLITKYGYDVVKDALKDAGITI